jgi:hypothetical protein
VFPVTLQVVTPQTRLSLLPANREGIVWAFSSDGESAVLIRLRSLVRAQQGPPRLPNSCSGGAEPYQVHQLTTM